MQGIGVEKSEGLATAVFDKWFDFDTQDTEELADAFVLLGDVYAHGNALKSAIHSLLCCMKEPVKMPKKILFPKRVIGEMFFS